jgi:hypothetical protein
VRPLSSASVFGTLIRHLMSSCNVQESRILVDKGVPSAYISVGRMPEWAQLPGADYIPVVRTSALMSQALPGLCLNAWPLPRLSRYQF